jgi:hypothetical protein
MGIKMAAHPEYSLPNQMQSWASLTGAYRLLNNPKVTMSALLAPHCSQTLASARQQPTVLWVEDTSELDFTHHPSTTGLGPIGDGRGRGLLLHSTLAVIPIQRQVLGLGHVQVVLRQPKVKPRPNWTRSPEGMVWVQSARAIGRPAPSGIWVHVSDSGSDNFEYFATCRQFDKHFLVRVFQNRVLKWEADEQEAACKLKDYARQLPPQPESEYVIHLTATRKQPARNARVVLSWSVLEIPPPLQAPPEVRANPPISAWVVRAWEPDPPADVEPLEWILITSLPVQSLADAQEKVFWYSLRWLCEDFHQCLKTGCKIEESQLDDGADLQKLLGFSAPIAVHLLQMRQMVRLLPDTLAKQVVDPLMVAILARLLKLAEEQISIEQFWLGVARLGGHLGRKGDGLPGWRVLWRGWRYLLDLTQGASMFQDPP